MSLDISQRFVGLGSAVRRKAVSYAVGSALAAAVVGACASAADPGPVETVRQGLGADASSSDASADAATIGCDCACTAPDVTICSDGACRSSAFTFDTQDDYTCSTYNGYACRGSSWYYTIRGPSNCRNTQQTGTLSGCQLVAH